MDRLDLTLPKGLKQKAKEHGICISQFVAQALLSEIVRKVEMEKKAGLTGEKK